MQSRDKTQGMLTVPKDRFFNLKEAKKGTLAGGGGV